MRQPCKLKRKIVVTLENQRAIKTEEILDADDNSQEEFTEELTEDELIEDEEEQFNDYYNNRLRRSGLSITEDGEIDYLDEDASKEEDNYREELNFE